MHQFVRKVKQYIDKHQLIEKGERLLIACSGGADSVAAVLVMKELASVYECELGIAHTDHRLRGEESAEDMDFVLKLGEKLRIPVHATTLQVPERIEAEGGNVQLICREERYSFFEQVVRDHDYHKLIFGHHGDDQTETVLMTVIRGSLSNAITGIPNMRPFSTGQIIRPLLNVTKKEIMEYLNECNVGYRHDPSNDKHTYTRNRIRHRIVPLLEEENPNINEAIRTLVEKQQQDDDFLWQLAKDKFDQLVTVENEGIFSLNTSTFSKIPLALQRRLILLLLEYLYKNSDILLNDRLIESILAACNEQEGNAVLHLPNGFFLIRHYQVVQFTSSNPQNAFTLREQIFLEENKWTNCGAGFSIYLTRNIGEVQFSDEKWFVHVEKDMLPLKIRQKKNGDRIQIKGMRASKKVSRLFIDEKVPLEERLVWPLLVTAKDDIIAVIGIRYGVQFSKQGSSQSYVLYIRRNQ